MTTPITYQSPSNFPRSRQRLAAAILAITIGTIQTIFSLCGILSVLYLAIFNIIPGVDHTPPRGTGPILTRAIFASGTVLSMVLFFVILSVLTIASGIKILWKNRTWERIALIVTGITALFPLACGLVSAAFSAMTARGKEDLIVLLFPTCFGLPLLLAQITLFFLLLRLVPEKLKTVCADTALRGNQS